MRHSSARGISDLACPYFVPTKRWEGGSWAHPSRLPLGAGWRGYCAAPGHKGAEPSEEEVREFCNLGYALRCPRLPVQRTCDALRFSVCQDDGAILRLRFVCETAHRPAAHGTLEYDVVNSRWISLHGDPQVQTLAECYLQSYLARAIRSVAATANCEPIHE